MTFKLGQQRKPIPHTPGVKELAPLSITTTPLNPIITNFLGLHHHTSTGTTTTTTTAAPAAAPRVVEIGAAAWAGEARIVVRPLRGGAIGVVRIRGRFAVQEGARVAVALARLPVEAHFLVLGVPTEAVVHALVATVHVHDRNRECVCDRVNWD